MKKTSPHYGKPILSKGWLPITSRRKNRAITRIQYHLLDLFTFLDARNLGSSLYSAFARKCIGGYLHSLKLEINSNCNLHCRMCYVPRNHQGLEFPLIRQLMGQLRNSGTRLEIMGGEPLMREDLAEIVRLVHHSAKLPFVMVYTNGTFATRDTCTHLKAAGLDAAIVTLISHFPGPHDDFTGISGSWDQTVAGIANLREAGIRTYTFTAIHAVNKEEIAGIQDFVSRELGAEPLFYQYIPQQKNDPLVIGNSEWYELKNKVLAAHTEHAAFVRDFGMLTGNACSGGNFVYTVKADGSVQPCPFISDIPLGNIREENFWKIISKRYDQALLKEFKSLPESCRGCTYATVCGGGCRAANKRLFGTYAHPDFRCLGPYSETLCTGNVIERLPCFF